MCGQARSELRSIWRQLTCKVVTKRKLIATAENKEETMPGIVVHNVRDFGAVGDGVTDDQPAFAAAVAAMPTPYGGMVHIPLGTYLLNSDWVIDRGVCVVGAYRYGSKLAFAAGKSMRLNFLGDGAGGPPSTVKRLYIRCQRLSVGDWRAGQHYSVGDLVYGTLSYGPQRNGFHYRCERDHVST
jgi:hypothetical protein